MHGEGVSVDDPIVISGIGVISSIGAGIEAFEESLYKGTTGVSPSSFIEAFGPGEVAVCEVRDFVPQKWLGPKGIRSLDRSSRLWW